MISKVIAIHKNRKELSALSGLLFFNQLITSLNLEGVMGTLLPHSIRNSAIATKHKFIIGIFSFIAGADCIEDIDTLKHDPFFSKITDSAIATKHKFVIGIFALVTCILERRWKNF